MRFLELNRRWSGRVHSLLGARYTTDGNSDFRCNVPWPYVVPGIVYDLGGGRHPFFSQEAKAAYGLYVIGVDISATELAKADEGLYDEVRVADMEQFEGGGDGRLVICQAVLEHVRDTSDAVRAVRSCLEPGGVACVFVPCRNALYARLNLLLPERLKRRLLSKANPQGGFKSYYNRCTPAKLGVLFRREGLRLVEERLYYTSSYFFWFLPAYLVWQAWVILAANLAPRRLCETMSLVVRAE